MPNENHHDEFVGRLPVYVINLAHDHSRWEAVTRSAEFHAPQFALHRIEAVDGRVPEEAARPGADLATFRRICGREMLPGEYGCYRSHLRALETFVRDGAPYGLILEDDVAFDADSVPRIEAVIAALPDLGVVKLVNHRRSLMVTFAGTAHGDSLGRTLHGPQGSAAAYLVSREGALHLLDALAVMTLPWDVALERFWSHGVSVFATGADSLSFTEGREVSNIWSGSGYDGVKYPWYGRLKAGAWRLVDHLRRIRHVLRIPAHPFPDPGGGARTNPSAPLPPLWGEIAAGVAILLFVSALWRETDAYRYAGLALVIAALVRYARVDFWDYRIKPYIGWTGAMCIGWAAYVAIRFGYSYLFHPELGKGTAEGVYLLPVFYATTGYALFLYARRPFILVAMFMAIGPLALAYGIDFDFTGQTRALVRLHNNPIHASIAAGFVALCAIPFALQLPKRAGLKAGARVLLATLAGLTFLIALVAIYHLRSKGVWLAMAVALPVLAGTILAMEKTGYGRRIVSVAVLIAIVGTIANFDSLEKIFAPAVETSRSLLVNILSGEGIMASLDRQIDDAWTLRTPTERTLLRAERERMMLWSNALHIWQAHPVFGAGISWLHEWQSRPYQETRFTILHNGYLEIAVRYGIVGLAFYAVLYGWAVRNVWRAARAGLVDRTAFQCYVATLTFFAVTLLTNSNNRLAIGESYMWFAAAFGFYCHFLLQANARTKAGPGS